MFRARAVVMSASSWTAVVRRRVTPSSRTTLRNISRVDLAASIPASLGTMASDPTLSMGVSRGKAISCGHFAGSVVRRHIHALPAKFETPVAAQNGRPPGSLAGGLLFLGARRDVDHQVRVLLTFDTGVLH